MSRYLDPKADIVFKKIFGEHPKLLISFLNAVLPLPEDGKIVSLTYLHPEQVPQIPEFKSTIADVKCTDEKGRIFIVEMQMNWTASFKQRLLFGTSHAFVKQLDRGEKYELLQPVYGLGIVSDIYDTQSQDWYHHYRLIKKANENEDLIEHLQLIFIELPKFPVQTSDDKKLRILWLRFLREINEKTTEIDQELLDHSEIKEAIALTEEAAFSKPELDMYGKFWDSVSRERTLVSEKFSQGKAEGRAEGRAEGEAKGRAEGRAEGKAEGRAEGKAEGELLATHKIALSLLKNNIPIDVIMKSTGLSETEIKLLIP